jgi:Swt1-like HEPN
MLMSNREVIGRGLELLAAGLGPFVDTQMTAAVDGGRDWISVLDGRDRSRHGTAHRNSLSDARFLLRVLTEQWRAFNGQLSRAEQSYASELRDTGNRWAHGEAFSADDTNRALDTMERLLTAVGAAGQAAAIRSLRLGPHPAATRQETQPADIRARAPVPPARKPPPGTGASWTRVTRADVIRAITEYDRLGQDQFLAEHGFGRATAYLLIHDGRSYDSKAIAGVAYKLATGVPLGAHEFSGGIYGAARVLRRLGFEVRNVRGPAGRE